MKVIIVATGTRYVDAERSKLLDWAVALGVDTKRAKPTFVLIEDASGWRAHFAIKLRRDGENFDYVLPGANRVATDYEGFSAAVTSWPQWFPEPDEIPDMSAAALLQALEVAGAQALSIESQLRFPIEPVAQ